MKKIPIDQLITIKGTIVDVRSPQEFTHGHLPGALNLPLFSDEERKIVGITYKERGQRTAIEKGLEIVQFSRIIQELRSIPTFSPITVYCARGGMRSSSMGWLLELLGYEVFTLINGYKSVRRWVIDQFSDPYKLLVLGGETGSGKTQILQKLALNGEGVVDLEKLAHHRGSVFGLLDHQPSQEQFENDLAMDLFQKKDRIIWIEDESERIGVLSVPRAIFEQIRQAPAMILQVSIEKRIQNCVDEYRSLGADKLTAAIMRLQKRLGGLETKNALDALKQENYQKCCQILLGYYDKKYRHAIAQRDPKSLIYFSL